MSAYRQTALLKEYEVAQQSIQHRELTIWSTASIFIISSMTGLFVIAKDIRSYNLFMIIWMAITAIIVLLLWREAAHRWASLINISFYRMRQIEEELNLFKNRYVNFLDNNKAGHYLKGFRK